MSIIELLVIVLISLGIFDKSKILYYFNKISKFQNGQSRQIIGDNSIVAAGSIVSGYFDSNIIIGGVPAKKIKNI